MSRESSGLLEAPSLLQRVIGEIRGEPGGPTFIATAGMHGNEVAGLQATTRVLERIRADGMTVRGHLLVLAGNLAAIRQRTRFIDNDLNREWTPRKIRLALTQASTDAPAETAEQRALIHAVRAAVESAEGTVHFLDMHTSSAEGPPFVTVGDTLRNRRFAGRFPLPLILGLEEQIDGSLLEYLNNAGFVTLGVEAGQHDGEESVDRLEAVLWMALVAAGLLRGVDTVRHASTLREASRGIPRVVEVRRRHAIEPADRFRMEPGYTNFRPVSKGQVLGRDAHGQVVAPEDGLILLPLYQGKGDDGFFIAREVRPFWLKVSAALRRLRVGRVLRGFPGVRRLEGSREVLVVNTRVARLFPLELFHLLGYRKLRRVGRQLVVTRRRHDLGAPGNVQFP